MPNPADKRAVALKGLYRRSNRTPQAGLGVQLAPDSIQATKRTKSIAKRHSCGPLSITALPKLFPGPSG